MTCRLSVFPFIAFILSLAGGCGRNGGSAKFNQYYNQGEKLYERHCSNCHQNDGKGLGRLYPPLAQADYLQRVEEVVCLIRYGKEGRILVNGQDYNMAMPGNSKLTDLEIAKITTYIYNSWGSEKGLMDVTNVSTILAECNGED